MKPISKVFAFKTVYSENKTYVNYKIGKKEEINYTQVQMLVKPEFREYFVPFQCTKTASVNKICFDVSGLTALSEYLKTELTQEQYFEIIAGIQRIASFCKKSFLSMDNLVCSLKYMYYHNVQKKVLMAYVPVKNPHYIGDGIDACLIRIHKKARHIIITDGNYMQKYETFLAPYMMNKGRRGRKNAMSFSPDSLLHFFHENQMNRSGMEADLEIEKMFSDSARQQSENYPIHGQLSDLPTPSVRPEVTVSMAKQNYAEPHRNPNSGGTFIRKSTCASLTDMYGNVFPINGSVFRIGRNENNDLVIPEATVSGFHAEITYENGIYFICDHSSNGTFLNHNPQSVSRIQLQEGDLLLFDEFRYVFHMNDQREVRTEATNRNASTYAVSQKRHSERPLAYLKRETDGSEIVIYSFPFQCDELRGLVLSIETLMNRQEVFAENHFCESLCFQSVSIAAGTKLKIFSGCVLDVNGERFCFRIES